MQIHERVPGDEPRIEALILAESRAKTRDRLRMVLLALRGWEAPQIAAAFTSIRRCVQTWVYRYRDGGIEALRESRDRGCRREAVLRKGRSPGLDTGDRGHIMET